MKLPTFSCAHIKQSLDLYIRPKKKNIRKVQNTFINKKNFGHNYYVLMIFFDKFRNNLINVKLAHAMWSASSLRRLLKLIKHINLNNFIALFFSHLGHKLRRLLQQFKCHFIEKSSSQQFKVFILIITLAT